MTALKYNLGGRKQALLKRIRAISAKLPEDSKVTVFALGEIEALVEKVDTTLASDESRRMLDHLRNRLQEQEERDPVCKAASNCYEIELAQESYERAKSSLEQYLKGESRIEICAYIRVLLAELGDLQVSHAAGLLPSGELIKAVMHTYEKLFAKVGVAIPPM